MASKTRCQIHHSATEGGNKKATSLLFIRVNHRQRPSQVLNVKVNVVHDQSLNNKRSSDWRTKHNLAQQKHYKKKKAMNESNAITAGCSDVPATIPGLMETERAMSIMGWGLRLTMLSMPMGPRSMSITRLMGQ
jgi:hypothetical protein